MLDDMFDDEIKRKGEVCHPEKKNFGTTYDGKFIEVNGGTGVHLAQGGKGVKDHIYNPYLTPFEMRNLPYKK